MASLNGVVVRAKHEIVATVPIQSSSNVVGAMNTELVEAKRVDDEARRRDELESVAHVAKTKVVWKRQNVTRIIGLLLEVFGDVWLVANINYMPECCDITSNTERLIIGTGGLSALFGFVSAFVVWRDSRDDKNHVKNFFTSYVFNALALLMEGLMLFLLQRTRSLSESDWGVALLAMVVSIPFAIRRYIRQRKMYKDLFDVGCCKRSVMMLAIVFELCGFLFVLALTVLGLVTAKNEMCIAPTACSTSSEAQWMPCNSGEYSGLFASATAFSYLNSTSVNCVAMRACQAVCTFKI